MLPRLIIRDWVTPLLLGNDMQSKLQEGSNHICWGKRQNRSRRSGNGLIISVLPQNPLPQVTHHLLFAGHDPSGVPTHILKRRHISSVLVRPPSDMTMLHQIQQASEVFSINKLPLVDMFGKDNVGLWSRVDDKRMGYTVEPPNKKISLRRFTKHIVCNFKTTR